MVTGASRGIGKAISNELWDNGYSLILISRSISDLKNVRNGFSVKANQNIYLYEVDITNDKDVDLIFKQLSKQNININL